MLTQTVAVSAVLCTAVAAIAQPNINSARANPRIFNDFPASTLSVINNYPAQVRFSDSNLVGTGFANRHNFRLSTDNGTTNAEFHNSHSFSVFADVTLGGTAGTNGEGGLQISPWWDPNVDGVLFMNTSTGEVAAFGGRLPFYSFTASQAITYTHGQTVRLGMEYEARSNTAANPGRIRYWYNAANSGWINFDQGNPGEDPPHGLWGILSPAYVGGYVQAPGASVGAGTFFANFGNIAYVPSPAGAGLLAFAGIAASRRRRT